jgi:hypothetical protein
MTTKKFKINLPFIDYRFELPDFCQGLLMCAVDLAAIPLLISLFGMPMEVALAVVLLNGFFYLLHATFNDGVVPGWITPAIPLILAFCMAFPEGTERIHALMALQMMVGLLSVVLGSTGWAIPLVKSVPAAIRSGVIMGAGIASVFAVFKLGGRFETFPYTISIAVGLAFYLMFSDHFQTLTQKSKFFRAISSLGIFPIIVLAIIIAPLFGEAAWPTIEWGITSPDFATLFSEYSVFGIGFPPLETFIITIPTVLAIYLVLFGDVVQTKAILNDAEHARQDEPLNYSANRAHVIFGVRNLLISGAGPDPTMAGPLWSAMTVVIGQRYKQGKKSMQSMISGAGSFRLGTNCGLLMLPIVSLVQPILGVALALTMIIQGYVSCKVGILEAKSHKDLGISGIVAGVLVAKGAAWAFAIGGILCILIYGFKVFKPSKENIDDSVDTEDNDYPVDAENNLLFENIKKD